MDALAQNLRREARVAFSLRAQPLWFRIVKWAVALALIVRFHDAGWFWAVAGGMVLVSLGVHLLYRMKTRTWTRAWGGWDDLEAGRG